MSEKRTIIENSDIQNLIDNKKHNYKIYKYYKKLEYEIKGDCSFVLDEEYLDVSQHDNDVRYQKRSDRISACINYWDFAVYREYKKMEVVRTFRCKDKFCTNCKRVRTAQYLAQFLPYFTKYKDLYKPMLLTLTVPNVHGEDLESTMKRLFDKFYIFNRFFNDKITRKNSYKDRKFEVLGSIRAFECTYNAVRDKNGLTAYHPHLHVLWFIKMNDDDNFDYYFNKNLTGSYNTKTKQYDLISSADKELRELWTRLYNGIDRRVKNYVPDKEFQVDITPIDDIKGILEVLKYSFKTTDIKNYDVFKNFYLSMHGKRLKQGYGLLYNLKFDKEEKDDSLELLADEIPEFITVHIKELLGEYKEYEKVSRFKLKDLVKVVSENLKD